MSTLTERRPFTTRAVDGQDVVLATRDYGGDGPALVLMHGAGMEQSSLAALADQLGARFRVVTFDFRGHGGTTLAPWSLESAVEDLCAVIAAYGLDDPAVGGHSLGGMVATAYGVTRPSCPGVVNIDGHGRGRVDQYPGFEEAEVRRLWDQQDRRLDRLTSGAPAAVLGLLLRVFRQRPVRAETAREVLSQSSEIDLFDLYCRMPCPLLVFNAVAPEGGLLKKLLAGKGRPFVSAFRQGITRDLRALAARKVRTELVVVDATHVLVRTHPELVARHIDGFLQP